MKKISVAVFSEPAYYGSFGQGSSMSNEADFGMLIIIILIMIIID